MILSRIQRGAKRTSVLLGLKLASFMQRPVQSTFNLVKRTALRVMVLQIIALPIPIHGAAIPAAFAADDSEPSSTIPLVKAGVITAAVNLNPLVLQGQSATAFMPVTATVQTVVVGKSYQTEQDEQAAAAKAAADAAAEAAKKAASTKKTVAPIVTVSQSEVADIIRHWADVYNVSENLMLSIAECESGLNPSSKNAHSSASGLFQFMPSTFNNSPAAGSSIWDANANAQAAAFKIANGGLSAWNASKSCWRGAL